MDYPSRRRFVQRMGAVGLALVAGCGRLPWQGQRPVRVPRIGYFSADSPDDGPASANPEALRQGLRDFGYVEGENIAIEWRFTAGNLDRLAEVAAELVRLPVDVLVPVGPASVVAATQATTTLPIVMASGNDPVGAGLVTSLARPGGNVTGLASLQTALSGKRLEWLKDTLPALSRVAVLGGPAASAVTIGNQVRETEAAAQLLGVEVRAVLVRDDDDFGAAFKTITRDGADGLIVLHNPFVFAHRAQIIEFAAASRLPAIYGGTPWVEAGGLMSYSASVAASHRRAAYYVDRILKGARPADLPIEQPMTFDFTINLKTARALGLTIPQQVL